MGEFEFTLTLRGDWTEPQVVALEAMMETLNLTPLEFDLSRCCNPLSLTGFEENPTHIIESVKELFTSFGACCVQIQTGIWDCTREIKTFDYVSAYRATDNSELQSAHLTVVHVLNEMQSDEPRYQIHSQQVDYRGGEGQENKRAFDVTRQAPFCIVSEINPKEKIK